jgi:hypothetical protein
MNIVIMRDENGGKIRLTTESPGSRYGIPVIRIEAADMPDSPDYGPGDTIVPGLTGFDLVEGWLAGEVGEKHGELPPEIEAAARRFLEQLPQREARTARLTVVLPPATKTRWQEAAAARRWTLTTLLEVAIEEYLATPR